MNDSTFLSWCPQVKFNQALADHSMSDKPRLIDGIVLTKFDTIDDKVLECFFVFFFCVFSSGFNHAMWLCKGASDAVDDWYHSRIILPPPPHRLALPSPWLTSRASPSCLWARGRPTTTCAASTPAPWSAPWWRLKWLHVLLFIHRRKRSQQIPLPRCREMF